jgi:methylmalonyl-CoA/ethylmalonyl-CoA epimerase
MTWGLAMQRNGYGPVDQIGYLVPDLNAAVRGWIDRFGTGPWTVFRNAALEGEYRGRSGVVTMDVALGYQGDIQIELIAVTNDAPSPYRNAAGAPLIGLHHVAWVVDDLDSAVERACSDRLRPVYRASNLAVEVVYCEAEGLPGTFFEFICGPDTRAMMENGIAAAREWDGADPIVEIDLARAAD